MAGLKDQPADIILENRDIDLKLNSFKVVKGRMPSRQQLFIVVHKVSK